ncbi:hypothetical protein [Neptuniibacter sp.]|uniref:hypothetical protein n=1 Tax=Neptuniibacter sp. TaxID=1962643 RepID=UPI00261FDE04|nr:hypothetical protein [Neptuniibacter sp.]MCP4596223.1 hypothetical protein [Neptuniibacter sp.]
MSELIADVGDFRGSVLAGAVGKTTNGFPQLVLDLHATDMYDAESGEWFEGCMDGTLTAYICMFGGNGKATLGVQQVIDATGWDGASFKGLNDLVQQLIAQEGGFPIGFTTKENNYNDVISIQVDWVRNYDAAPGRTIAACTPQELKDLDATYAKGLQVVRAKAKVAAPKPTTKPKAPTTKPKPPAAKPEATAETTDTTPPPTEPPAATKPTPAATGKSTKGKAWIKITSANKAAATDTTGGGAGFSDDQVVEIWQTTTKSIVGEGVSASAITREQWFQIQEECVAQVTVPF